MIKMQLATAALLVLAGCGKQDYRDPEAFLEHYGQDIISKKLGPEKEWLGLDYFKFTDVHVGIDPVKGEFVSALVAAVPKRGMKYHRLSDPRLKWADCSLPDDWQHKYIAENVWELLRRIGEELNHGAYCPIIYDPQVFDATKIFSDLGRVRIYRDKDSSGVLMPVSGNEAVAFYESYDKGGECRCASICKKFSSKTIANEEFLKRHNAIACSPSETTIPEDVKSAIETYNTHVANVTNAFLGLRNAVKDLKELEERNKSRPNDDFYWVVRNARKEYDEAKMQYDQEVRAAKTPLNDALQELKRHKENITWINRQLNKAKESLQGAKSSYEATKRMYEDRAAKPNPKGRRDTQLEKAKSQLPSKEAHVVKCREKVAELENQLSEANASLAAEEAKISSIDPIAQDRIEAAKHEFDSATAGLSERWRVKHGEALEAAKLRLKKSIDRIFAEVAAMNAAIGNVPGKSSK